MISKISSRFSVIFLVSLTFGLLLIFAHNSSVNALSGSQFNAGRIIDDSVFFNDSTMSVTQIQAFLNSKVPTCDTNGAEPYGGTTRAAYGTSRGYPPPYTCLKAFSQNIPTITNGGSDLCTSSIIGGAKSSAQIIYDVGKACDINPMVLIVLLEKEQSLVTDVWPWSIQYRSATGYGCPDTAPCDSEYYGFFNQVYQAAQAFKRYEANPNSFNYKADRNNTILYHPNSSCGSSNVFIDNQATANLYIYTPYRPNSAALNNLYGTGNSCSSYGNRNFWRIFNDWFGSTSGTPFFKIGNNPEVYILGASDTYYHVTSSKTLEAYGYGTTIGKIDSVGSSYISGKTYAGILPITARFEGASIYLIDRGHKRNFPSRELYEDTFGYTIGDEAKLPQSISYFFTQYSNMQPVLDEHNGPGLFYMENKKKRHITNMEAYASGSPAYSTLGTVNVSKTYIDSLPTGDPIIPPNSFVKHPNINSYIYWNGISTQTIQNNIVSSLGITPDFFIPSTSFSSYPAPTSTLSNLAKSSTNQFFLLDSKKKIILSSTDLTELGLNPMDFISTSNEFLNRVTTEIFTNIFRKNNSAAIYTVENGDIKQFLDLDAISQNGFNPKNTKNINSLNWSLFNDSGVLILPTVKAIRLDGLPSLYLVNSSSSKVSVPSAEIYKNIYGLSFSDVVNTSSSKITDNPTDLSLGFFVKKPSGQVWLISSDKKRSYVSPDMLTAPKYNLLLSNIPQFPDEFIKKYGSKTNLTTVLQAFDTSKVYIVENGQKRWVLSKLGLQSKGFTTSDIRQVDKLFLDSLPSGSNIN